jgi:hypothetical protein
VWQRLRQACERLPPREPAPRRALAQPVQTMVRP